MREFKSSGKMTSGEQYISIDQLTLHEMARGNKFDQYPQEKEKIVLDGVPVVVKHAQVVQSPEALMSGSGSKYVLTVEPLPEETKTDYNVEKDEFDQYFTRLMVESTGSCFERDVLRGCKGDLWKEWKRLIEGGEPKFQTIPETDDD